MQYGFQRLVLLNSAGYSRAVLPLDGSVSLVAPNNTGKTSLINALQFLLIIDRRRMDFGAHDVDKSRRFYFPNNSAYILLEVTLPEVGTVVLGCVGKGVSYEYEYFAYAGQLNIDEFRLHNGALVSQPQLASHLAGFNRQVLSYGSGEFRNMVYGSRGRRPSGTPDFCVFRLEHADDYLAYQSVLTRTLRLDKLRSSEVKDYLLQIFRRDLPDAHIDFKAEWDRVFAEVNAERAQYDAAVRTKARLDGLVKQHEARLTLRGKIQVWQPLINSALQQWQAFYLQQKQQWQSEAAAIRQQQADSQQARDACLGEMPLLRQQLDDISKQEHLYADLASHFALISDRAHLEHHHKALCDQRDELMVRLRQVAARSRNDIEKDQHRNARELQEIRQEIHNVGNNLYLQLQQSLPAEQHAALAKVLGKRMLTLAPTGFQLETGKLITLLQGSDAGRLVMPGLQVELAGLPAQHEQRPLAELQQDERNLQAQQSALQMQLRTVAERETFEQQQRQLEQDIAALQRELEKYEQFSQLHQARVEREMRRAAIDERLIALDEEKRRQEEQLQQVATQLDAVRQHASKLEADHQRIDQLRHRRLDLDDAFKSLHDLPCIPWLAQEALPIEHLASHLQTFHEDCRRLKELDTQVTEVVTLLHSSGLTKYQMLGSSEDEIERLITFSQHLPQEQEALEKKARAAVVNIALCLKDLRGGLDKFCQKMQEFNRKIGGRQLSDLATFKILPEEETRLVEAIDLLIITAANVESGESFELFNQQSMLDDDQLNRAKNLLIAEGSARQGLRVSDLFRLRFWVGKTGQAAEAFDDLDSAASNGTVLMAKLVTGLAMLHQMQDLRRPIQGVCYLDEALALDARNQRSLIDTAQEFGFSLIFASPAPLTTARYCVPIHRHQGKNQIGERSRQELEPLEG